MVDTQPTEVVSYDLRVNGTAHECRTEPRKLLADVLREDLGLTGTHLGCEQGVCGTCTVLLDGIPVRSCLMFGVQVGDASIETIEGLAASPDDLHPIQRSFWEHHGLQCGFCTPGVVLTAKALLKANPDPTEEEVREAIAGNMCRCTGYMFIVESILAAAQKTSADESGDRQ